MTLPSDIDASYAEKGVLYVVATPIGNLADISDRALKILRSVDFILCEDTRHSAILLERFAIRQQLLSYFAHNEALRTEQILPRLLNGESAAVISDAGSPGISDPGARIVDACLNANIRVSPIPGPSAVVSAVSAAGFYEFTKFHFVAFFPRKSSEKRALFEFHIHQPALLVGYESPQRILDTLNDLRAVSGDNQRVCLCRELTKKFETIKRASVAEMIDFLTDNPPKGEICLVIEGTISEESSPNDALPDEAQKLARLLLQKNLSARDIRDIVADFCNVRPKTVYQFVLDQNA